MSHKRTLSDSLAGCSSQRTLPQACGSKPNSFWCLVVALFIYFFKHMPAAHPPRINSVSTHPLIQPANQWTHHSSPSRAVSDWEKTCASGEKPSRLGRKWNPSQGGLSQNCQPGGGTKYCSAGAVESITVEECFLSAITGSLCGRGCVRDNHQFD